MGHPRETEIPERDYCGASVPTRDAQRGRGSLSGEQLLLVFFFNGCMFDDYLLKRKSSNLVISLIGVWGSYRYEYEAAISGAEQNP